jgi:hypothetical protein
MIASLLPGLRDLRTPLAAGYLWIVGLWLLIHQHVPKTVGNATGPIRSLYELGNIVGSTASLAALTFVAYIIGSLLSFRLGTTTNSVFRVLVKMWTGGALPVDLSNMLQIFFNGALAGQALRELSVLLSGRFREAGPYLQQDDLREILLNRDLSLNRSSDLRRISDADTFEDLIRAYQFAIIDELSAVGIQLQARNRDFWDTYDRLQSEAHFRLAVSPPMVVIFCTLAAESGQFLWLALLVIPIILISSSIRTSIVASSTLIQAIALKMVEPPILEQLTEEIARKKGEEGHPGKVEKRE